MREIHRGTFSPPSLKSRKENFELLPVIPLFSLAEKHLLLGKEKGCFQMASPAFFTQFLLTWDTC